MEINVKPNIEIPEVPTSIEVKENACLRDALCMVVPQVIDEETGEYKYDPDIWGISLNEVPMYALKEGLDTQMKEGDTIKVEFMIKFC
jgi:hypothetical protein